MSASHFKCKQEEYIPIMEQAWKSIIREKVRFTAFSPMYNEAFFTEKGKAIQDIKLLIHPQVLVSESKNQTELVNSLMESLRPVLNALESYVNKANGQLTALPADFGFTAIREDISSHNKEGVVDKANTILQLVNRNLPAIQAKGFTEDAKTEFETIVNNLASQSLTKGQMVQDVAKNYRLYKKELVAVMNDIMAVCKDGKIIFAESAPEKVKDFTFAQLVKLVRLYANNGGTTPPAPSAAN